MRPRLLSCFAIAESTTGKWILKQISLRIVSNTTAWTSGEKEENSTSRWQNASQHALLTNWLICLAWHLHFAQPPGPKSGRTLYFLIFLADRQWWRAITGRAINVWLPLSINNLSSFSNVICDRCMYAQSYPQFTLLQIKVCISELIIKTTIKQKGIIVLTLQIFVGHVNYSYAYSLATIFQISAGDCNQNL